MSRSGELNNIKSCCSTARGAGRAGKALPPAGCRMGAAQMQSRQVVADELGAEPKLPLNALHMRLVHSVTSAVTRQCSAHRARQMLPSAGPTAASPFTARSRRSTAPSAGSREAPPSDRASWKLAAVLPASWYLRASTGPSAAVHAGDRTATAPG